MSSIDTNLEERDDHVRSDDFFNAEAYPFRSTRLRRLDDERFTLTGDLTMRDVTREITLAGEYEGQIDDPWGNRRAAFTATTQISRNDFNIRWNLLLETGGLAVSDNVQITLHIEAILQAPSPSEPTMSDGVDADE